MVSALFEIFIGFTGLIGFLLRFIGPISIAPTITLIGVALFNVAADQAGKKKIKVNDGQNFSTPSSTLKSVQENISILGRGKNITLGHPPKF